VAVVARLKKAVKTTLTLDGKQTTRLAQPAHIQSIYKAPKGNPSQEGLPGNPHQLPKSLRQVFRTKALGQWASVNLAATPHRLHKGWLLLDIAPKGRRRARRAHFYEVSLPKSVHQKFKQATSKKAKKVYMVRFRIVGLKLYRRYPAKHWMPHPHGGFHYHDLTGQPHKRKK